MSRIFSSPQDRDPGLVPLAPHGYLPIVIGSLGIGVWGGARGDLYHLNRIS